MIQHVKTRINDVASSIDIIIGFSTGSLSGSPIPPPYRCPWLCPYSKSSVFFYVLFCLVFFFFIVRFCSSNRLRVPELSTYPTVRTSAPIWITMTSAAWVIPELHPSPTSIVPHLRPASTPPVKTPENFS